MWLHDKYHAWSISDSMSDAMRVSFVSDLMLSKKFDTWGVCASAIDAFIRDGQPASYADLCAMVYYAYASVQGKRTVIWGDKNNFHVNHLGLLAELFPCARYLNIVRDGRDVLCSYREVMANPSNSPYSPRLDVDVQKVSREWARNVIMVRNFLLDVSPAQAKTVRYDDLVATPDVLVNDVCNWLGVQYSGSLLSFNTINKLKALEPKKTMDWKRRTLEPISAATVGRYKNELSENEVEAFISAGREPLEIYGYI